MSGDFQISQKLCFKNGIVSFDAFDFNNDRIFHEQIQTIIADNSAFVRNGTNHLSLKLNAIDFKFHAQS